MRGNELPGRGKRARVTEVAAVTCRDTVREDDDCGGAASSLQQQLDVCEQGGEVRALAEEITIDNGAVDVVPLDQISLRIDRQAGRVPDRSVFLAALRGRLEPKAASSGAPVIFPSC